MAAVCANVAYHLWSLPEDFKRTFVSAVLGQASMPVLVTLFGELVKNTWRVFVQFLEEFLPQA
jgi:hypothetical protein